MHRSWIGRAFHALMAIWLVLSLSEPALLHSCPVHSGRSAAGHGHAAVRSIPDGNHHAAAAHAPNVANQPDTPRDGQPHQCTCLGQCCCSSPVGLSVPLVSLTLAAPVALRDAGLPDYDYVPVAAEHVLPFQNGPPLAL